MEKREKKERGEQGGWSEQEATPACSPSLPSACRVQAAQVSYCRGAEAPLSSEGPPGTQQQSGVQTSALLSGAALRSWSDSGAKVLCSLLSGSLQACATKWRGPCSTVLWGSCSTVILNALMRKVSGELQRLIPSQPAGGAPGTQPEAPGEIRGRPGALSPGEKAKGHRYPPESEELERNWSPPLSPPVILKTVE